MNQRRPSIRTHLCNVVVEDSVSLLFSASHWPSISIQGENNEENVEKEEKIRKICLDLNLPSLMEQAAVMGSIGSVAILVQAIDNELVLEIKRSCFLEPSFSLLDPRRLIRVREQYIVDADGLEKAGFGSFPDGNYWFTRDFTENETIWYEPVPVEGFGQKKICLQRDEERTVHHGLGVVPIVWIRNLPNMDPNAPDGKCTFSAGIDAMIDSDYLLSQTVRGLRYSSDPTMVLSVDEYQFPGGIASSLTKDASHAIALPQGSEAKLLEINGTGAAAALNMWQALRSLALEAMHGNRTHGDRVSAAQSGRAMELMCLGLTWLVGRLRRSYGDLGLVSVIKLICRITQKVPELQIGGKMYGPVVPENISLVWPAWFEPTFGDMQTIANAVQAAKSAGAVSLDTAVRMMKPATHVQHIAEELKKILDDNDFQETQQKNKS
ncbi:phage portal protein [Acetobacter sp. LMG 1627]|uniref:Phage portal protein n=1 Tax=Acetobacter conturbans TaxID=1737472 RepID=A0ABX0K625_9PROT|nr:phage portal protein [Acetobacter conturbans]